jgi:4-hydroxybenzoate polyprenyltransferase
MSEQHLREPTLAVVGWIDRFVPAPIRPYLRLMRLDRPIGIWLRLFPAWWALALASKGPLPLMLAALFAAEAILSRGLGCTVNDILDRRFDAQVERTRDRPLAARHLSVRAALVFLVLQLVLVVAVLASLNALVLGIFVISLVLAAIYPLMKRITWWPQAFLGLVFSSSTLMGWAALTGHLSLPALLLYAGCISWTVGYDTIYAHQDKRDDARVGVKSTALYLGAASKRWIGLFYALAVLLWGGALALQTSVLAALVAMLALTGLFVWQLRRWAPDSPALSLAAFKSSRQVGWLLLAAIVVARGGLL